MEHLEVPQFLGLLAIALASAKLCGFLAKVGELNLLPWQNMAMTDW